MNYVDKLLTNKVAMVVIYIVFALAASIQSFLPKPHSYIEDGKQYFCTQYNNYVIFKSSFNHLVQGKDLYRLYLEEHDDFYKYSPTAALFFGLFVGFPDAIGLSLWNILNALMILAGVYYLPALSLKSKGLILLGTLIETMTCMQNEQSNALVGGLIILAFGLLERRNYFLAVFCIVFSAYIKVFSIAALALFIFYPGKWKLTLYTVFWSVVLFLLPLTVVNFAQLRFLYASWGGLLAKDHSIYVGLCVSRWLSAWFNLNIDKTSVTLVGAALFCLPFLRVKEYAHYSFRLLMLCSVLLWVVIFNHKAESPTFVIAMSGVAIWFFSQPMKPENLILFILAFVFTSLSPTDIFPAGVREGLFTHYVVKVAPCIFIWFKILYDQLFKKTLQLQS